MVVVQLVPQWRIRNTLCSYSRAEGSEGRRDVKDGEQLLPFARMFTALPKISGKMRSEMFTTSTREKVEQGDALMPVLFSLGKHVALKAISHRLLPEERLFALLDDLSVACQPARVAEVQTAMREELWRCVKITLHHGKTKVWNRGGTCPDMCEALTKTASWEHQLAGRVQCTAFTCGGSLWLRTFKLRGCC